MATVLQPGSGSGDVVSGALSLNLDQHSQIGQILAVPLVKRLQQLQTRRLGVDSHLDIFAALWDFHIDS